MGNRWADIFSALGQADCVVVRDLARQVNCTRRRQKVELSGGASQDREVSLYRSFR